MKLSLPVIDFSNIERNTPQWKSVRNQVKEAFEHYGSFEVKYDDVPLSVLKATMNAVKQFHDLPIDTKKSCIFEDDNNNIGYLGNPIRPGPYEGFGIPDALSPELLEYVENTVWPQGNSSFSEPMRLYGESLAKLEKIIRRMALESLGLEKYVDEHIDSTRYVSILHKYQLPEGDGSINVVPEHTDKNYITILYQNEVDGLEIMTRDGQRITYHPTTEKSFIVIMGEAFHALSNGRLIMPIHSASVSDRVRYTLVLFVTPKCKETIKVPPEMVDEEHPLMYKPYVYGDYIKTYDNARRNGQSFYCLKDYCGV